MTLRGRLTLIFAGTVALLVVVGGQAMTRQLNQALDSSLDLSLAARADALAQQVGPDGSVSDFQDSGDRTESLIPPAERLAQVVGPDGRLVESSTAAAKGPLLTPAELDEARRRPVSVTSTLPTGEQVRLLAVPVSAGGDWPSVVVVGTSRTIGLGPVREFTAALRYGGPAVVTLAAVGGWMLAGAALRPVERMRRRAAAIVAGDTQTRLPVPEGNTELTRLAQTLNDLLGRMAGTIVSQRRFVADASHELRSPLTSLRAELELAAHPGRHRDELAAAIRAAATDTDRLIRLSEDLLVLARGDDARLELTCEWVELAAVIEEAVSAHRARAAAAGLMIATEVQPVTVLGDRLRIRQVLDNLIDNALRHAVGARTVTCVVRMGNGYARLIVEDDGPGFPAEFLPRAFRRFSRADPSRTSPGTGLGLAIVQALAHAHGGRVWATNRSVGGASVVVELPVDRPPPGQVS